MDIWAFLQKEKCFTPALLQGGCSEDSFLRKSNALGLLSDSGKGGWKAQGRFKHTMKTSPQKRYWTPRLGYVPPPSGLFQRSISLSLRGSRHKTRNQSRFPESLQAPKLVLEGALYSTFSPPPKWHDNVLPHHLPFPTSKQFSQSVVPYNLVHWIARSKLRSRSGLQKL